MCLLQPKSVTQPTQAPAGSRPAALSTVAPWPVRGPCITGTRARAPAGLRAMLGALHTQPAPAPHLAAQACKHPALAASDKSSMGKLSKQVPTPKTHTHSLHQPQASARPCSVTAKQKLTNMLHSSHSAMQCWSAHDGPTHTHPLNTHRRAAYTHTRALVPWLQPAAPLSRDTFCPCTQPPSQEN